MSIRKGRLTSQGLLATPVNFPIATIHAFAGTSAPDGWAMCDGSEVSRTDNAALFAAIGETYGVGDGSTTFNLPDMRGEFLRGLDNMGTAAGARGKDVDGTARTVGQAQSHAFGSHNHQVYGTSVANSDGSVQTTQRARSLGGQNTNLGGYGYRNTFGVSGAQIVQNTGGTETRPANMAINYIIKL